MRCHNCGFISFDYLDQCVKCRTDLTGERQRLNLLDLRPNPVSFQEIMERMPIITQKEKKVRREEETVKVQSPIPSQKQEIDLSQGLSLDISIPSDLKASAREQNPRKLGQGGLELTLEGFDISDNSENGHR